MKEKMIYKPHYKNIPDGFIEVKRYVTENGREFSDEKEAKKYEASLHIGNIKHNGCIGLASSDTNGTWYFPKDEKEIEYLLSYYEINEKYIYGKLLPNEWVYCYCVYNTYDDEYPHYLMTLSSYKEEIQDILSRLEKCKDG